MYRLWATGMLGAALISCSSGSTSSGSTSGSGTTATTTSAATATGSSGPTSGQSTGVSSGSTGQGSSIGTSASGSAASSSSAGTTGSGSSSGAGGSSASSAGTQPEILLFGGWDAHLGLAALPDGGLIPGAFDAGILGDTWTWNGTSWTQHDVSGPPGRYATVGGDYDGGFVLFGGESFQFPDSGPIIGDGLQTDSDTWTWDGTRWTLQAVQGPSERALSQGSPYQGLFYLYGGYGGPTASGINDLWTWDGARWTQIMSDTDPSEGDNGRPRPDVSLGVTDFGGDLLFTDGYSVWTWDGAAWSSIDGGASAPRSNGGAATLGDRVIFFTNANGTSQTWSWDGSTWSQLSPATEPPPRDGFGLAGLPGQVVLFGGTIAAADGGTAFVGDTWIFDGTNWTQYHGTGPSPRSTMLMATH